MMNRVELRRVCTRGLPSIGALMLAGLFAFACSSTKFVSTWRSPTAAPLEVQGAKVAAVVLMQDEASRRAAEDTLAQDISARGAQGIPMYTILPNASVHDEAAVRAALESAQVAGVVTMRPLRVDQQTVVDPAPYVGPAYAGYWGGYYAYGGASPWGPAPMEMHTDVVVSVETLIYSLKQNQLVWAGRSKTTNPAHVNQLIGEIASAAADELQHQGLIAH